MRAVLDTNVVVSAMISASGIPGQIIRLWQARVFSWLLSESLLAEYGKALLYPHVVAAHRRTTEEVLTALAAFRLGGILVTPTERISVITADPADNAFLECAEAGAADYIVSGDRHLLDLGSFRDVPIVRPATFLAVVQGAFGPLP